MDDIKKANPTEEEEELRIVAGYRFSRRSDATKARKEIENIAKIKDRIDGGYSAIGFSNELTVCFIGVATGEFKESTSAEEEIEADWYTKEEVRDLLKNEKFAARTQAYCIAWSRE